VHLRNLIAHVPNLTALSTYDSPHATLTNVELHLAQTNLHPTSSNGADSQSPALIHLEAILDSSRDSDDVEVRAANGDTLISSINVGSREGDICLR
jgi:hypothetical protein